MVQRRACLEWPIRSINSRRLAPVAAAIVFPVCRPDGVIPGELNSSVIHEAAGAR
jgi:hypothetical protein